MNKKNRTFAFATVIILTILVLILSGFWQPSASAAPQAQVAIFTPTPGPDGKIIWVVRANDTLLSISLITGVSVDELRTLNNLPDDNIIVGQKLVIGLAGPAADVTPTIGPSPTPTTILPTPSPKPGVGTLCVILFNDANGDLLRQEEEPSIPGGAISLNNRAGSVSLTADTDDSLEHKCFPDLPEGEYSISVAVPVGYNPTTTSSYTILLRAGDQSYIDFGAQANSQTIAELQTIPEGGQRSPLWLFIGIPLLLIGIGLVIYASGLIRTR